ncbi:MAG: NADH pyrophosphatase [Hyphococcus sp.]|nr:MAG: NADH pyrophosphatase [Marinicaulis sp.]
MKPGDNPNWFANGPLTRFNTENDNAALLSERLRHPDSLLIPLWRGDPLVTGSETNRAVGFLSAAAANEFPANATIVALGQKDGRTYFAIDASTDDETSEQAPFADIGEYMPLRMAAGVVSRDDLAIIGHAHWLLDWHQKHPFCAVCGEPTKIQSGGAKRTCPSCTAEHFPRSNPVAIVLAVHKGACLLGRGPHFPPGFLSALAGFVEAGETPEEAAKRELFEEAGVTLTDVRYQFSQPWPFSASLMMGFIADTTARDLTLDTNEIEEARWVDLSEIKALLNGEKRDDIFLPPKFTIARQLLERWAG